MDTCLGSGGRSKTAAAPADVRYAELLADPMAALPFVEECRQRRHDDLLIEKPGWNRGTPA